MGDVYKRQDSVYERINYQGKPMSDEDQVIIVDDDGKEQPYGIEGEIPVSYTHLTVMIWKYSTTTTV